MKPVLSMNMAGPWLLDRVVMEWTVNALSDFESLGQMLASDAARKDFAQWEKRMNDMVHYAETEVWQLH